MAETQGMKEMSDSLHMRRGSALSSEKTAVVIAGTGRRGCRPAGEELILNTEANRPCFIHTEEIEEGLRAWP